MLRFMCIIVAWATMMPLIVRYICSLQKKLRPFLTMCKGC